MPTSRLEAALVCCLGAAAGIACAALVAAAVLVPAPPVVLPLIGGVCIGCPLVIREELRAAIRVLRDRNLSPLRQRDIARLQRELDRLPETEHPLER